MHVERERERGLRTSANNRVEDGTKVPLAQDDGILALNLCITKEPHTT